MFLKRYYPIKLRIPRQGPDGLLRRFSWFTEGVGVAGSVAAVMYVPGAPWIVA